MSREQMIHDAAIEIMRDVGIKVHNAKADGNRKNQPVSGIWMCVYCRS